MNLPQNWLEFRGGDDGGCGRAAGAVPGPRPAAVLALQGGGVTLPPGPGS